MIYFDERGMTKLPKQFWGKEYWVTLGFSNYLHFLPLNVHTQLMNILRRKVGDNILDETYADIAERVTARAEVVKPDSRGFVRFPKTLLELADITDAAEFVPIETLDDTYWRVISVRPSDDGTENTVAADSLVHTPDQV